MSQQKVSCCNNKCDHDFDVGYWDDLGTTYVCPKCGTKQKFTFDEWYSEDDDDCYNSWFMMSIDQSNKTELLDVGNIAFDVMDNASNDEEARVYVPEEEEEEYKIYTKEESNTSKKDDEEVTVTKLLNKLAAAAFEFGETSALGIEDPEQLFYEQYAFEYIMEEVKQKLELKKKD